MKLEREAWAEGFFLDGTPGTASRVYQDKKWALAARLTLRS